MKILFVCRHNAFRSILAEAIAKKFLSDNFEVASGGSNPTGEINPLVIDYLRTLGFDPEEFHSTSWEERLNFHPDVVLTVCDTMHGEPCPNWLADGIRVAWDLEPIPDQNATHEEILEQFDKVVNSLKYRILQLEELNVASMSREEITTKLKGMSKM